MGSVHRCGILDSSGDINQDCSWEGLGVCEVAWSAGVCSQSKVVVKRVSNQKSRRHRLKETEFARITEVILGSNSPPTEMTHTSLFLTLPCSSSAFLPPQMNYTQRPQNTGLCQKGLNSAALRESPGWTRLPMGKLHLPSGAHRSSSLCLC